MTKRTGRLAELREAHPMHGKPWTEEDDHFLREMFDDGISIMEMAGYLGRTEAGIFRRLQTLGIKPGACPTCGKSTQ